MLRSLLLLTLALAGCTDHGPSPAIQAAAAKAANAGAPIAQSFEVTIDGVPLIMTPDAPREGHTIVAGIVGGRSLTITAGDKAHDFLLSLNVDANGAGPITAGAYSSYQCRLMLGCDPGTNSKKYPESLIGTFPGAPIKPGDVKLALLAPKLGLSPLTVTLDKVEDVYWPGVGDSKRIKGSFSGTLAHVEEPRDLPPKIVGPVKKVEGKFDLYTVLR